MRIESVSYTHLDVYKRQPLTGAKCVTDIVTERCYFEVTPEGLVLRELAAGYTVDDIKACTEADFIVPDEIGVME